MYVSGCFFDNTLYTRYIFHSLIFICLLYLHVELDFEFNHKTIVFCFADLSFLHYVVCSFKFQVQPCLSKKDAMLGVDLETLIVYFNLTSANIQLIHGKVPWRGGR